VEPDRLRSIGLKIPCGMEIKEYLGVTSGVFDLI